MFKSKMAGTKIFADNGLHLSGGSAAKIHLDKSDVLVSNPGSSSTVNVLSGPTKESVLLLSSGSEAWKMHMSMSGTGGLFFSNKGVRVAMTRTGQLGVGVKAPREALHVAGSALMESSSKAVFATMKAASESQPAGVRLTSGTQQWQVMTSGAGSRTAAAGSLQFAHGTKTHVVISKTGGLGVGLGVPMAGTSLHVKGPSMYDVGKGKGKLIISTPNGKPGISFFDNGGFRRMDLETHSKGISFTSASGFLGVGTKAPKSKLHVYDAKNTMISLSRSGRESLQAYVRYAGPYMKIGTASADGVQLEVNKQAKLTVHPNGNVGVSTALPKSQLQVGAGTHLYQAGDTSVVAGNAYFDGAKFKFTAASGASGLQMKADGSLGVYTAAKGAANMEVADFGKPRLVVTGKGLIGVGTQNPDTSLHLASTKAATLKGHGALMIGGGKSKENIVFDTKTMQTRTNGQPSVLRLNPFGGHIELFASSTKPGQKVTFSNTGRIGFGPKKPIAKFHVSEGPGRYATVAIGESKAGVAVIRYKEKMMTLGFSKGAGGAGNKEDAVVILKNGYVGIGTASPKSKLHIAGDVNIAGKLNVGGKQIVTMMEDLMKENQRLSMELSATKEMLMSMSANMKLLQRAQSETQTAE